MPTIVLKTLNAECWTLLSFILVFYCPKALLEDMHPCVFIKAKMCLCLFHAIKTINNVTLLMCTFRKIIVATGQNILVFAADNSDRGSHISLFYQFSVKCACISTNIFYRKILLQQSTPNSYFPCKCVKYVPCKCISMSTVCIWVNMNMCSHTKALKYCYKLQWHFLLWLSGRLYFL